MFREMVCPQARQGTSATGSLAALCQNWRAHTSLSAPSATRESDVIMHKLPENETAHRCIKLASACT